jgi:hypothetical protein
VGIYALHCIPFVRPLVRSSYSGWVDHVAIHGTGAALFWVALVNLSGWEQYYGDVVNCRGVAVVVYSAD